jgi:hypothetical protein
MASAYAVGYIPNAPADERFPEVPVARYLWVLDASDPSALPERARLPLLDARAVAVDGDRVVVASGSGGLYLIRAVGSGEAVPTPTAGATRTPLPTATPYAGPSPTLLPRPTPTATPPPPHVCLPSVSGGGAQSDGR